ncbi:beta-propeller domain-containing protein [Sphingomonas bacterium]|uniref:beta-propeller domain-containing protein n=1 Tax=Sphingomonas bacterium TaxID=1895847 RepID=UPI00262BEB38|nr:beta-propeller domain-containing protein [Sphingomonas bacterium]MDB5679864.1 hypothetical protein [Sphingomonas bacterium]
MIARYVRSAVAAALLIATGAAESARPDPNARMFDGRAGPLLQRFTSEAAFRRYLKSLVADRRAYSAYESMPVSAPPPPVMAPAPPPPSAANAAPTTVTSAADIAVTGSRVANPNITNNQNVGVDEGGIVKQIGNYLVVLQDGRVFSVDLGAGEGAPLRLADRIDVYRSPAKAASWYDEMLVLGDRILVTAYNYNEGASEITVLRMARDGRLSREGRYLISSNDYYSTDNYATRLIGDTLVIYTPVDLSDGDNGFKYPRVRRADGDGEPDRGKALLSGTDIYAPPGKIDDPVLHAISFCPLRAGLQCRTTAFVGPEMREFYLSPTDAFLWIGAPSGNPWGIDYGNMRRKACPSGQEWRGREADAALLYKVPVSGAAIGAVAVEGVPSDQFAFDAAGGHLRALLGRVSGDCAPYDAAKPLALLDIPLSAFSSRVRHIAPAVYAPLPPIEGGQLENRFVGDWLVYGGRTGWDSSAPDDARPPAGSSLYAVPLARPWATSKLAIPHNAIRIERTGNDAIVTGYRDARGLSISYVSLNGRPRIASTTLLQNRFESEGRSHAFNAWVRGDGSGMLGLPTTVREWRSGRGWSDSNASQLSFIGFTPAKALDPAGELTPGDGKPSDGYRCAVSCIDWYGNSRPIFTGGRILALMGTDLVEGRIDKGRIREVGRVDLTARPRR